MAESDTNRRLDRLKVRPALNGLKDDYLKVVLMDALDFFMEYTHRVNDPGERVDGLICDIAAARLNKEGLEGAQAATVGDISTTWYGTIDPELIPRLNGYRLVVGLNAEYKN